jgi:hypothetical protein
MPLASLALPSQPFFKRIWAISTLASLHFLTLSAWIRVLLNKIGKNGFFDAYVSCSFHGIVCQKMQLE